MAAIVAWRRSSFTFSISAREFLFKFLGTGFALTSRLITSGTGIILGFGLVRLNGIGCVIFLNCSSSAASSDLGAVDLPKLAELYASSWLVGTTLLLLTDSELITLPVARFST
jgi:hypothetical protein